MMPCKIIMFAMTFFAIDLGRCEDYEFDPKIFLDYQGSEAPCVNPRALQENYCLSWEESVWQKAKKQGFKCYLEQKLVYDCTPEGDCTDFGILVGNVRPSVAAQDCHGLPFANIKEDTAGNFICVIKDTDSLIQASLALELCADYRREYIVELILEIHGEPASCINEVHISDYCLSPKLSGQSVKERVYNIYLNGSRVYSCEGNSVCQGHGKLADISQSLEETNECLGISLKYLEDKVLGSYSVIIEDDTHLLQAKDNLQFCKDSTHSSSWIKKGSIIAVMMGLVISRVAIQL